MRLIDADELRKCFSLALHGKEVYNAEEILMTIQTTPTLDAEPVRHGHWVVDEDGNIKCSECGHHSVGDNYCERCGAKMNEVKDNE